MLGNPNRKASALKRSLRALLPLKPKNPQTLNPKLPTLDHDTLSPGTTNPQRPPNLTDTSRRAIPHGGPPRLGGARPRISGFWGSGFRLGGRFQRASAESPDCPWGWGEEGGCFGRQWKNSPNFIRPASPCAVGTSPGTASGLASGHVNSLKLEPPARA